MATRDISLGGCGTKDLADWRWLSDQLARLNAEVSAMLKAGGISPLLSPHWEAFRSSVGLKWRGQATHRALQSSLEPEDDFGWFRD
jgi:hypothetical protein